MNKQGFYWDTGHQSCPFAGRWQYRFGANQGGADSKEAAIMCLKMCGASDFIDTTYQGRALEFSDNENDN